LSLGVCQRCGVENKAGDLLYRRNWMAQLDGATGWRNWMAQLDGATHVKIILKHLKGASNALRDVQECVLCPGFVILSFYCTLNIKTFM